MSSEREYIAMIDELERQLRERDARIQKLEALVNRVIPILDPCLSNKWSAVLSQLKDDARSALEGNET